MRDSKQLLLNHLCLLCCSYTENNSNRNTQLLNNNGANVFVRNYDLCRKHSPFG